MALARALAALVATFTLIVAAPSSAQLGADVEAATAGSGGALAHPLRQGEGGGSVAPESAGDAGADRAEGAGPRAVASQEPEPTPTTPEGEEQPGEEQPPPEEQPEEQPPGDEEIVPPGDDQATGGEESAGADESALGFLPSTGLEIGALAALGAGLLLAGIALRPRRPGRRPSS